MAYLSDIEIAQSIEMRPISEIAAKAGVDEKYVEHYGKYKAKIDLSLLKDTTRPFMINMGNEAKLWLV